MCLVPEFANTHKINSRNDSLWQKQFVGHMDLEKVKDQYDLLD